MRTKMSRECRIDQVQPDERVDAAGRVLLVDEIQRGRDQTVRLLCWPLERIGEGRRQVVDGKVGDHVTVVPDETDSAAVARIIVSVIGDAEQRDLDRQRAEVEPAAAVVFDAPPARVLSTSSIEVRGPRGVRWAVELDADDEVVTGDGTGEALPEIDDDSSTERVAEGIDPE